MAQISEPIVVPLNVKCTVAGCNCVREGISGNILKGGGYSIPEKECPSCKHPGSKHTVTGETKSDYEKNRDKKPT